MESVFVLNS